MVGGLILFALAWGASAIIKATILRGPTSFPKALGIGIITVIPLVTILPPSQAGTFSGMLSFFLWLGYSARTQRETRSYLTKNSDYESTVKPEKKEPIKPEKPTMSSSHDDEEFYEQVAAEFNDGTIKQGLWLKAETKAGGDKGKSRLLYTEWRVGQLTEEAEKAKQAKAREELLEAEAQAKKKGEEEEVVKGIVHRMSRDLEVQGSRGKKVLMRLQRHGYIWVRVKKGFFGGDAGWRIKNQEQLIQKDFHSIEAVAEWVDRNLPK